MGGIQFYFADCPLKFAIRQTHYWHCTGLAGTLNRSTYYKDSKHKPTKAQASNDEQNSKILKVYYESKRRYGAPKIFNMLRNEGEAASLKRLQRWMAVLGITSVIVKKYKSVKSEINVEQKENIMNRDFTAASSNQK